MCELAYSWWQGPREKQKEAKQGPGKDDLHGGNIVRCGWVTLVERVCVGERRSRCRGL